MAAALQPRVPCLMPAAIDRHTRQAMLLHPRRRALVLSLCALVHSRRVGAHAVPKVADGQWLTEGQPVAHIRAQVLEHYISIVDKVLCKLLLKEATIGVLQARKGGAGQKSR